jgi:RNA polymerase sigma-54 factor
MPQIQRLRNHQVTTAHLTQTMMLLSLTNDELKQQIDHELASNPALELLEERYCPTCHRNLHHLKGPCPICSKPKDDQSLEPVVFLSPVEDFYVGGASNFEEMADDPSPSQAIDLPLYVLRQIGTELDKVERKWAAFLLTHLDEDGLLTIRLDEVARYYHVPVEKITKVVRIIQRADPIGVGSSSPKEAMLIQLEVLAESKPVPPMAKVIIIEGLDLLSRHQYSELGRKLKVPASHIRAITQFISENLNPFPARSYWGDMRQPAKSSVQVFHRPDVIISFLNNDPTNPLAVEIIMPMYGTLRVNPLFKQVVHDAEGEKKEDWKNDLDRASLFVKCLQQRNHTMQRLMFRVVLEQRGYILNGEEWLKSMTRAQFARELDVHESTISRAVANKTVQLPNKRIVSLSTFFDRSLNVRTVLKGVIGKESFPLSDTELVECLAKMGYFVARRTVAKYRKMEGILPAHLR